MLCVYDRFDCNAVVAIGLNLSSIDAEEYLLYNSKYDDDGVHRYAVCNVNDEISQHATEAFNNNEKYYLEDRV